MTVQETPDVPAYYEATRHDIRILWSSRQDLAVHFGYVDERHRSHRASLLRMNEVLAEAVSIGADDRVLDAGCGYGGSALWLAEHRGCDVTGITLVPFQASEGSQWASRRNLQSQVRLLLGDFGRTPFADGAFTVFWALESLVHAPDRAAVFSEAHRLLLPGGRLVLTDCFMRSNPPLTDAESESMVRGLNAWAMPALPTAEVYCKQLEQAGFADVKYRDISPAVAPSLRRLKRMCQVATPAVRLLRRMGVLSSVRAENVEGSREQITAFQRGLWSYSLISARRR